MKTRGWRIETRISEMEDGRWPARSVLDCGGKRSATPLSETPAEGVKLRRRSPPSAVLLRRTVALPEQSIIITVLALLLSTLIFQPSTASAQQYSIDWHKTAGGGGTSTNGQYSVSGTIGQHDAGGPMTGGSYSLTGGFWSLITAVQTPGLPNLTITFVGPDSVVVSWPNTGSYTLQTNNDLSASNWPGYGGTINTASGTNSVTITPSAGNLFFRLKQ